MRLADIFDRLPKLIALHLFSYIMYDKKYSHARMSFNICDAGCEKGLRCSSTQLTKPANEGTKMV